MARALPNHDPGKTGIVPVEEILCTKELHQRPARPPDYQLENHALQNLAQLLADSPRSVLQALAEAILETCRADSAGISLLSTDDGGRRFYWPAIAGKLKGHVGGGTPRNFGPCGDVLDRDAPLLMRNVERRYTYLEPLKPPIQEALLVPFYVQGKAVGTVWAIAHSRERKFDAEDERMMRSLASFAASAYQVVQGLDSLRTAAERSENVALESGRLAAIVDSSDDIIISKTLDGTITSWNRTAERLLGYNAEEAIGRNITLIIPKDRRKEETQIIKRVRLGERVDHFETVRQKKDGTLIDLSITVSPVRDGAGVIVGASKVARDVSEHVRAQQAKNLMAAIIDNSDDAIISKNLHSTITSWNKGAERIFGFTAEEAVGQPIFLVIPQERRNEEAEILSRIARGERIEHFETVRQRKDGQLLDVSLTISPVHNSAGAVVGASKIARDVTSAKRAERMILESEERLRILAAELESKVEFRTKELVKRNVEVQAQAEQLRELSTRLLKSQDEERRHVARELHDSSGQILAALAMGVARLGRFAHANPPFVKALEEAEDLVRELGRELRTTSYLLHPPLLDLSGLPEAIRWYIEGLEKRAGLQIDLQVSADFGRLSEDLELTVFRIVQESLTNIHRHSGSKTGTIRLERTAKGIKVEVQDYGKGLPAQGSGPGTVRPGVGIMGMQERVRHMRGQIEIASSAKGTTVSVELPTS